MSHQRIGRVGREFPGVFYKLYTKKIFDELAIDELPGMVTGDITSFLFTLIKEKSMPDYWYGDLMAMPQASWVPESLREFPEFDYTKIDTMNYPSADSLAFAAENLFVMGAIDGFGRPTRFGVLAHMFPCKDMRLSAMILNGYVHGASVYDLITIAAIVVVCDDDNFYSLKKKRNMFPPIFNEHDDVANMIMFASFIKCELITVVIWIYLASDKINEFIVNGDLAGVSKVKDWCDENGIDMDVCMNIIKYRGALIDVMATTIGLNPYHNSLGIPKFEYNLAKIFMDDIKLGVSEIMKIKQCMYEAFRMNVFSFDDKLGMHITDFTHMPMSLPKQMAIDVGDGNAQEYAKRMLALKIVCKSDRAGLWKFAPRFVTTLDDYVLFDDGYGTS